MEGLHGAGVWLAVENNTNGITCRYHIFFNRSRFKLSVYHILIDRRWRSGILYVRNFRRAECDIKHKLVVAKVRERLAVSKQETQKFCGEKFNPGS